MMLQSPNISLTTLRVSSGDGQGLIYYESLTTGTALTTAEKATQTNVVVKRCQQRRHQETTQLGHSLIRPSATKSKIHLPSKGNDSSDKQPSPVTNSKETQIHQVKPIDVLPEGIKSKKLIVKLASSTNPKSKNETIKIDRHRFCCEPGMKRPHSSYNPERKRSNPMRSKSLVDAASSNSSHGVKGKVLCGREKNVLSLPNVSWNEIVRCGNELKSKLQLSSSVSSSTINLNLTPRVQRPQTAGPRVIVPLKHSCPIGLKDDDMVIGKRLGQSYDENDFRDDVQQTRSPRRNGVDGNRTVSFDFTANKIRESFDGRFDSKDTSSKKLINPFRRCFTVNNFNSDNDATSLELTITSFRPGNPAGSSDTGGESGADSGRPELNLNDTNNENNDDEHNVNDRISFGGQSRTDDSIGSVSCNANTNTSIYDFNTIEGIRKSYRRAQSAPPSHQRKERFQSGAPLTETPGRDAAAKPFSSLYWRAKSAYHKRVEASSSSTSAVDPSATPGAGMEECRCRDIAHRNDKDGECIATTKHTLLRALLHTDGESTNSAKHTSHCPNKCRGCFKACLVSNDYLQKAIARAVQESAEYGPEPRTYNTIKATRNAKLGVFQRSSTRANFLVNKSSSQNLVHEALGRTQPLFQRVYGNNGSSFVSGRKTKIRPWPSYQWLDLKSRQPTTVDEEREVDLEDDDHIE